MGREKGVVRAVPGWAARLMRAWGRMCRSPDGVRRGSGVSQVRESGE